jgi:hypothetical protein
MCIFYFKVQILVAKKITFVSCSILGLKKFLLSSFLELKVKGIRYRCLPRIDYCQEFWSCACSSRQDIGIAWSFIDLIIFCSSVKGDNMKTILTKTIPLLASTSDWPLLPRQVKFDWTNSPLHWIPQDPLASHVLNHFSFTLVRGEYFFCRMFNKALPLITDDKLRDDVKVFIRQEAIHSQAHKESIEQYLQNYGVNVAEQYQRVINLFDNLLADKPLGYTLPQALQKQWLLARVCLVAAAEHYTCALGQYVLMRRAAMKHFGETQGSKIFKPLYDSFVKPILDL